MKKIVVIALVLIFLWLVSLAAVKLIGGGKFDLSISGVSLNKIAIVPIEGTITFGDDIGLISTRNANARTIVSFIEKAESDGNVKGIVLEINSPGGTVVASEEIAKAVKKTKKPTIAVIKEIGTSGAYWVASAADKIIADPMSITGSIGVTSSYLEFSGLMEKYGVGYEELKTGEFKDTGSPYRKLNSKEKSVLQNKINLVHDFFVDEIAKNRNLKKEDVENLANGMFYLGLEAKENGLVDVFGDTDTAVELIKETAKIKEASLVRYEVKRTLLDIVESFSASKNF